MCETSLAGTIPEHLQLKKGKPEQKKGILR